MKLDSIPRVRIAFLPTPLHKLENISKLLKTNIYVKRDDLTGFGFGGNKIRKLEFLFADAKEKNSDTILTAGAIQSNHCRQTASLASKLGFETHLFIGGRKPRKLTGNILLDNLVGANLHFIDTDDWDAIESEMKKFSEKLSREGKKPYIIPIGGSVPLGALGYVIAAEEIKEQSKQMKIKFSHVFHESSSGGTQAGLEIGKRMFDLEAKIIGVGVSHKSIPRKIFEIAKGAIDLVDKNVELNLNEINVDMNYIGESYGIKTNGCVGVVEMLARKETIFLDYVYTGKAFAALIDYARKGKFSPEENVLFIHTGGNVQLFA